MGMAQVRIINPAAACELAADLFIKGNMEFSCCAIHSIWRLKLCVFEEWETVFDAHRELHKGKEWWNVGCFKKPELYKVKHAALLETARQLKEINEIRYG